MSWRDRLVKASFRGAAFQVESHELSGGRRGVMHEYVQRDKPAAEDTGRKGRTFTIDAYVVGTDYFATRDALLKALETEGPGELLHPYLGRQLVQAFAFRMRETTKDGGMVTFSITFAEAGENEFPRATVDNRRVLEEKTEGLLDQIEKEFSKVFSVLDKPQFVVDEAVKKINGVADKINEVTAKIAGTQQKIAETNKRVQDLKDKASDLVHTPEKLAKQITDALRGVVTSIEKARDQFKALGSMFHHGSDDKPVPTTTSTREQQATNQTQINRLVQVASVSLGAQRAVEIPFESTKDAREVRAEIVDNIERHEKETSDDETFQALVDVKTETIKGIPAPEEALPTIGNVTLAKTTPSIVMTYDLYENPIYEDDIIARNKIAHPGFVPGGEPLEVLQVDG